MVQRRMSSTKDRPEVKVHQIAMSSRAVVHPAQDLLAEVAKVKRFDASSYWLS